MQYKTVTVPVVPTKIKAREFRAAATLGISAETAQEVTKNVSTVIDEYAKCGWILHSLVSLSAPILRKKSIGELLLGWIPILGRWLCPNLHETRVGREMIVYNITFVKETAL